MTRCISPAHDSLQTLSSSPARWRSGSGSRGAHLDRTALVGLARLVLSTSLRWISTRVSLMANLPRRRRTSPSIKPIDQAGVDGDRFVRY